VFAKRNLQGKELGNHRLRKEIYKGKNWATTVMLARASPLKEKIKTITIKRVCAPSSKRKNLKNIGNIQRKKWATTVMLGWASPLEEIF